MDFFRIKTAMIKVEKNDVIAISPDFIVAQSQDLMVRGGAFYAIWDEEKGLWSTSELDVARLVDEELYAFQKKMDYAPGESTVKSMTSFDSQSWVKFKKYVQSLGNSYTPLDESITFAEDKVEKGDYVSKVLPYSLEDKPCPSWDELVGVLYDPEERAKIEFFIGAVVAGDSKRLQKFGVFYGDQGTGKGTILKIIHSLFSPYTAVFEAKALGQSNNAFAAAALENNPLVALQYDGDLSRIEDNTKLNSIISHEDILMNQKHKAAYMTRINALLLMGTNQPVKISDSRSGIIRRLIDIHPTGNIVPSKKYLVLMNKINFELGAIANHCLNVYKEMGFHYYDAYRPLQMMFKTDAFFNYVEANFEFFNDAEGVSLKQAWALYKEYCEEARLPYPLQMHKFKEELKSYFHKFDARKLVDGQVMTSWFSEFDKTKFEVARSVPIEQIEEVVVDVMTLDETESLLDELLMHQPAQYANRAGTAPAKYWSNTPTIDGEKKEVADDKVCDTELSDLNTTRLHFVKVPEDHIVIDFDLKGKDGKKSLERNLEAASLWPPTYAELSKSGEGVHLHYHYVGSNLDRLVSVFDPDGIEVKVYRGDASLRRKLSKCNNTPVADLTGGIPLKEKSSLLTKHTINSERHLRQMLVGNLQKKYMPGTKSSVDFMKKLLDEAYDLGIQYDVTDMRSDIIAFANNSTNQKMAALRVVQQMKFVGDLEKGDMFGEDPVPAKDGAEDESKVALFDVEVYPDLFTVCWKFVDAPPESTVKMVNPTPSEIEALLKLKLVGFYNRRYDNHILYARLQGYNNLSLFNLSKAIVEEKKSSEMFGQAYNLSYADIWDFSSVKQSLKKFMIDLGIRKVEMEIPWDVPVAETAKLLGITLEEMIQRILEYNTNDVLGTEAVWKARQADFRARQILAELSGLTVNDTTQRHTARILFGMDRHPQSKFNYTDLKEEFPGYDFDPTRKPDKSLYHGEAVGEGGYVYAEPGMYDNVAVLDVASMHPTSIRVLNMFGPYTSKFGDLVDARIAIKRGEYEAAGKMLDGRLKPYLGDAGEAKELSYALKIVINIVYGLTAATFDNPFKHVQNRDNIVAKRGALFMVDLKHFVQERGFQVVHIKTDSIKIPNATQEIIDEVTKFGEKYGYDFEHESTYEHFALVNDAVYIANERDEKGDVSWTATGAQFAEPYVFKTMFSGEEVVYDDYAQTKQVTKGALYLDFEHDKPEPSVESMTFIGRIGRFVPVTEDSGGAMLRRVMPDGKIHFASKAKGFLWMDAEMARVGVENGTIKIDMSYYEKLVKDATKAIENVAADKTIGDLLA